MNNQYQVITRRPTTSTPRLRDTPRYLIFREASGICWPLKLNKWGWYCGGTSLASIQAAADYIDQHLKA